MAIGAGTIESLFAKLFEEREAKYPAGLRPLERAAELYGPGYMAGQERLALTGAKEALGARGLGGTTRPQAISAGMKAGFEDVRRTGLADALARISQYIGGTAPTAGELAHLVTGGFSGMLGERGMRLQELAATTGRPTLGPMASQGKDIFGRPLGGGLGNIGQTLRQPFVGTPTSTDRIGGAVVRAGGTTPDIEMGEPVSPIYYGAAYKGEPTAEEPMFAGGGGGQFGGVGATGTWEESKPEMKPYIEGYNYAYQWYKKTGEKLSQREAYAKLKGEGPTV